MSAIFLGLGSNLGDRLANLKSCLKILANSKAVKINKISSVYESEPYGDKDQPWFLNVVIEIATSLDPMSLLIFTQNVEQQIGRKKTRFWGPRIIDIDILSYENRLLAHPMLQIPHPQLHLRQFVLLPLKEIAARFIHPGLNKTIDQLINECQDKCQVAWFTEGTNLFMVES
jgi:2-amino-4-hydroxy-6-hydroxymethyldihydropteridine diphosphokinase